MSMRLSGLVSGMDTDAMIEELVSAYSKKKDKIVKQKKTLEYKQDAWKEMNAKIYGFYTGKLSNMQLTSNYALKNTKSSNEDKATVTASSSAVNGTQELRIKQLAKTSYLTGAAIKTSAGEEVKLSTKLADLGIEDGKIDVEIGGEAKTVELTGKMTVKELQAALSDAGLSANFDEQNGRFFISSKTGGVKGDFTLKGLGQSGKDALKKLGVSTVSKTAIDEYKAYLAENDAAKIESDAKSDYVAGILMKKSDEIKSRIDELNEKLGSADGLTTDEQNELDDIKAQITEISGLLENKNEDGGFEPMEQYVTDVLGETLDYDPVNNADYKIYVDIYQSEVDYRQDMVDYATLYEKSKTATGLTDDEKAKLSDLKAKYGELYNDGVVKIDGQDSIIELNGAEFTSNTNTIQVNGLTINAKAVTEGDEFLTITTDTDVDAIYDKIKDFFKEYNELMKEMSTKYNAASAGDYEPLTEEEEEQLSDKQQEKWEKILTTAALRKDSSLNSVMSSMRTALMKGYDINGKNYTLSTFGIKTMSYFLAEDNEKNSFHIDGDKDDESTAGQPDKLRAALASDPENTIEFFSSIMKDLYKSLSDKMSKSTSTHSAFKLYNDKTMTTQMNSYNKKISEWEKKIDDYRDKYVKKFSAMETAMAKLQSKTSAMSSFFGS